MTATEENAEQIGKLQARVSRLEGEMGVLREAVEVALQVMIKTRKRRIGVEPPARSHVNIWWRETIEALYDFLDPAGEFPSDLTDPQLVALELLIGQARVRLLKHTPPHPKGEAE